MTTCLSLLSVLSDYPYQVLCFAQGSRMTLTWCIFLKSRGFSWCRLLALGSPSLYFFGQWGWNAKLYISYKLLFSITLNYQLLHPMVRVPLFLILLMICNSFYIAATPKLVCLHFKKDHAQTKFKFQTNSENPDQVAINIINHHGSVLQSFQQESGEVEFDGRNPFKICFQSLDNTNKAVTIDVWSPMESHTRGLAKKSQYYQLHTVLRKAADGLRQISRLQRFQEDRQNVHSQLISQSENSIRVYGILKMVVMISLAIGQIVFFKRLFGGKKVMGI